MSKQPCTICGTERFRHQPNETQSLKRSAAVLQETFGKVLAAP